MPIWSFFKKNIPTDVETLNAGLEIATKRMGQPIQAELRDKFPALTDEELEQYNDLCQKVYRYGINEVFKLIDKKIKRPLTAEDLKPLVIKKYAWVNQNNLLGLLYKGIYITVK